MLTDYVTVAMNGLKETFDSLQSTLNQMTVETTSEKEKSFLFLFFEKDDSVFGKIFFYNFYKARQKCFPVFQKACPAVQSRVVTALSKCETVLCRYDQNL